ncbi:MAG: GyrI-like domain-containing protein [Bacteroidota bacterium]|nr:GyrI-like domain-containing protein [Bacteroidota bacterium]
METITVKYRAREMAWPEKQFLTKRARISFDKLTDFFSKNYSVLYKMIRENSLQANEAPCTIYYSVDEAKKEADLAAAIPVYGELKKTEGFEKVVIPASKALYINYYGSCDDMKPAYDELEKYAREHGLKKKWMIEQYFFDPAVEKDSSKWRTDIYFVVE